MQNWVRSRHKSLNGRLKNWVILTSLYRHDLMKHGNVFWAIAVITQISINVGEKLFEVGTVTRVVKQIMNEIRIIVLFFCIC
jgi:hypothetical protein